MLLQGLRCRNLKRFTAQYAGTILLVMLLEDRPADAFRVVGQEEPVAVAASQVDRRVTPALCGPGGGGAAGLHVGIVRRGQAEVGQALLAALQHAVEGGKVLAVLNGVPGALQNLLHRVVGQGIQPQLFDLLELLRIGKGGVVLIVVIQPEQGEDLVNCLYMGFCRQPAAGFSLPTRCR